MDFFPLDCFAYAVLDWSLNVHCRNCKNEKEINVSLFSDPFKSVHSLWGDKDSPVIPLNIAGISERNKLAWRKIKYMHKERV